MTKSLVAARAVAGLRFAVGFVGRLLSILLLP